MLLCAYYFQNHAGIIRPSLLEHQVLDLLDALPGGLDVRRLHADLETHVFVLYLDHLKGSKGGRHFTQEERQCHDEQG